MQYGVFLHPPNSLFLIEITTVYVDESFAHSVYNLGWSSINSDDVFMVIFKITLKAVFQNRKLYPRFL